MKATVEPLEGNRVKLSVQVDEAEFEQAVDAAFRKIAREVRIPGFRPGKAPRKLLEARLGSNVAREEALRDALPQYYSQAVVEHEVDVIAPPDIEITEGQETGPVVFDAVVEIRPQVSVAGYGGLRVELPRPEASDEEIDAQVDRLRDQFGELDAVDRPAIDGDHVTISIAGTRDGEPLPGLQADEYLYEVGAGTIASELDDNLRGAKVGDVLEFAAQPADPDQDPVDFRVLVKDVKQKVLPDVTDEWANEVSEFDTVADLRADLAGRLTNVRRIQGQLALRERAVEALAQLVDDDVPQPLVDSEIQQRLQDLSMRLQAQGISAEQYLAATGKTAEDLVDDLREVATQAVRADLALRGLADAENLDASDDDLDDEFARLAERVGEKPDKVRAEFERANQVSAVRSDLRKRKALDWLVEHVEIVDEDGQPLDRADFEVITEGASDDAEETAEQDDTE